MRHDFAYQRRIGEVIERSVAGMFQRTGMHVIPSFDWSGKDDNAAPTLQGPDGRCAVLPDLQCFKKGQHCWLEVKFKSERTLHRMTNTLCTGINWRLFDHYRDVEDETGAEAYLLFVHADTGEMRGDVVTSLERYPHHDYSGDVMGKGGMLFWQYDELPLWGSLSAVDRAFARSPVRAAAPRVRRHRSSVLKPQVKLWPKPPDERQTNFFDLLEEKKAR
jgi:hypothetical protein